MFKGSMVALVTPFTKNNSVDKKALKNLINWHISSKTDAIVLTGTTGESPTLSDKEKLEIFKLGVDLAKGKTKVIAGTGSYSTENTYNLSLKAKEIGVDAVLVVVPYYNKPPIMGIVKHFEKVASLDIPIILYHHPGRTGKTLRLEDFKKLEHIDQIVAIKEASSNIELIKELSSKTRFDILSGDDLLTVESMQQNAKGVISVIANIIPKDFKKITDLCLKKDFVKARTLFSKHESLIKALGCETNPISIKYALSLLNRSSAELRLPLVAPNEKNKRLIEKELLFLK